MKKGFVCSERKIFFFKYIFLNFFRLSLSLGESGLTR